MSDISRSGIFLAAIILLVLGSAGLFAVDAGSTSPDPVMFEETVTVGLTIEAELALENDVELPRMQVFYSQYQYVVGYYGVETFVETQRDPTHEQRFGHPLTVYVSDYAGTGVDLTEEGYPTTDRPAGWTDAESAWFVVESGAQTPAGETVVSFSDRDDAEDFAEAHGGTVENWESVLERSFERDDASVARDRVDDRDEVADDRVEATAPLADRPTSITVGEDVETVQAAIEQAPANTTVHVPAGTYEEELEIDRPITLAGDGNVTLRGDGNGSVMTVTADRVAVQGVHIEGVGNTTSSNGHSPVETDEDAWDTWFTEYYASTDVGIGAYDVSELLIRDVTIDTQAGGIIAYESHNATVQNVTVTGPGPTDGVAGVLLFQSPGVVEDSTVDNVRDGIYLFRSPTAVVRSNVATSNLLGIHLMHTDDVLIADNDVHDQHNTGLYVMTGPERNAIVGNEIRDTGVGLDAGGTDTYVAENLIEGTTTGIRLDTTTSIYEDNVIAGNDVGADVTGVLPTNHVVDNDFVGNDVHATTTAGPLRIWTDDGTGNYWQGGAGITDGDRASRSYAPTDAVDQRLHVTDGTPTLAYAPALQLRDGIEGAVPGMRTGSIVDQAPACEANNPTLLERTDWADRAWTCYETTRTTHD